MEPGDRKRFFLLYIIQSTLVISRSGGAEEYFGRKSPKMNTENLTNQRTQLLLNLVKLK